MAGEVGYGATTGAMQGASTGAMLGSVVPGVGTAVGAIVGGALGAIGGAFGGSKAKKAKKYARMAAAIQKRREQNAAEATMLQQIREGRITRAASIASSEALGISTSSLSTSALSSVGSQLGYNLQYLGEDRRLYSLYSSYMSKAGKAAQSYQNIMSLQGTINSTLTSLAMAKKNGMFGGGEDGEGTTEWLSFLNFSS